MARMSVDLPQPFGPENGHVLAGADAQVDVVQHHAIAARDVHLAQFQKVRAGFSIFDTRSSTPAPPAARLNAGLHFSGPTC